MNVLLSPQPTLLPLHHEAAHISPSRSVNSPYSAMANSVSRKRKADDDMEEMSVSPRSSPALPNRQLGRTSKKHRQIGEIAGRSLNLPRTLETLDTNQLRTVLQRICANHSAIEQEILTAAPRPSVQNVLSVLGEYEQRLKDAVPYGQSSAEYVFDRVRQPLIALTEALTDFTLQFLPPNESQVFSSLQFLDGATKIIHTIPDWTSPSHRVYKDNAYEEISRAWILVINEVTRKGSGLNLHTNQWDQILHKHNIQSSGRLLNALSAMQNSIGWIGGPQSGNNASSGSSSGSSSQGSIVDQLLSGNYGPPVRVGRH